MANTSVIRLAGKTTRFDVTATSYASTLIDDTTNDQVNFASFTNVGSGACIVRFTNYSPCPAAVWPADFGAVTRVWTCHFSCLCSEEASLGEVYLAGKN
jgi:hypothetical protein